MYLRNDNGSQFTADVVKRFLKELGVDTLFVDVFIPGDDGPNWGTLFVSGDDSGVTVGYKIGETDGKTGKLRRYALKSGPVSLITSGNGFRKT